MFEAQYLPKLVVVFGPWMPRGGDYHIATADLVGLDAGATLNVDLFSKNREDTTNGTIVDAGTTIAISTADRGSKEWGPTTGTGLKEIVRYRYECTGGDWVLFRMLPPVWFDAVKG
jgi:hypothetical protein